MIEKRQSLFFSMVVIAALLLGLAAYGLSHKKKSIVQYNTIDRLARIYPDYSDTVIPPNIAPLNFLIQEAGNYFYVKIHSQKGNYIEVYSRNHKIIIPQQKWHRLLDENRNEELCFDIYVRDANNIWSRFASITNKITDENIDSFLVYRKIHSVQNFWRVLGIYQRNLSNYDESPILKNESFDYGCVNCHTFCSNRPDIALYPTRSDIYGVDTLLVEDTNVQKINAKFTYSCWHPSAKLLVFSANKIVMFSHSSRTEIRDVLDLDSLLAYYVTGSEKIKTIPPLSRKDYLETYPTWSPDGRFLYFCCASKLWPDDTPIPPKDFDKVKYDLLRISYDITNDRWGEPETVISSEDTGLSVTLPRISPDGRWLLFCMSDYGCFNAYNKNSDLYLTDLNSPNQTGQIQTRRLAINSDQSESWHCWSTNSRWIVFSSKRDYGIFTRSYISYIDKDGNAYKPFILPQKDPLSYSSSPVTYNTPELIDGPVTVRGEKLASAIRSSQKIPAQMPITMATPKAEGSAPADQYRRRE